MDNTRVPEELLLQLRTSQHPVEANNQQVQKPDSAWHFKRQRDKLKHLTEFPTSFGSKRVGTKDVSYLANASDNKDNHNVSDSLLPNEFHIVKTRAVVGLEYQDEHFTTKLKELPIEHQAAVRLRTFPSLKPSKRNDAIQLMKILDEMLTDAGLATGPVRDVKICTEADMHHLVQLIEKEQKIYNLVMHELIRQVTVECVERGELLSKLRERYAGLINKIPGYMNNIYNRSLALESMEKRLALKLCGFKTRVEDLVHELSQVQQKEREASGETVRARRDLDDAVKEARRSADLLHEYQSLYEMQRERLEKQVSLVTEERDLWTQLAYSLALKVIDENSLTTCKAIQVSQTAWTQLGRYFVGSLLKSNDSIDFTGVHSEVNSYTEMARVIANGIIETDESSLVEFRSLLEVFQNRLVVLESKTVIIEQTEGHGTLKTVHAPEDGGAAYFTALISCARPFENTLEIEIEKRAGEQFVTSTEKLKGLERQRDNYSTQANMVFARHAEAFHCGAEDSATSHCHTVLARLNTQFAELTEWYLARINGENGMSDRLTFLQGAIDKLMRRNVKTRLSDIEWLQFHTDLKRWIAVMEEIVEILDKSLQQDHRIKLDSENTKCEEVGLLGFIVALTEWVENSKVALCTNIQSLMVRIDGVNSHLMKWLSDYLIECAPSQQSGTPELEPGCPPKTSVFVTTGLARRSGIANLLHEANAISVTMKDLTEGVRLSVKPILSRQLAEDPTDAGLQDDMKRIETFLEHCEVWRTSVGFLLSNCFGVTIDLLKVDISQVLSTTNIVPLEQNESQPCLAEQTSKFDTEEEKEYAKLVDRTNSINAISFDGNVHALSLQKIKESAQRVSDPATVDSGENFEVLNTVEQLQKQLGESEETIHGTEVRCNELHEKILELGKQLKAKEEENEKLQQDLNDVRAGRPTTDATLEVSTKPNSSSKQNRQSTPSNRTRVGTGQSEDSSASSRKPDTGSRGSSRGRTPNSGSKSSSRRKPQR